MKIIANTNGGFMLEADRAEVALILGIDSPYSDEFKRMNLSIGTELEISKINETSEFVRSLDKNKLQLLRGELSRIISKLDDASEIVQALTLFDKLRKEEEVPNG